VNPKDFEIKTNFPVQQPKAGICYKTTKTNE